MAERVAVGKRNLVSQAQSTLHVFGAMMRREWWGLPTIQAAFEQALQRGVNLHLMLGPFFDMGSFEFMKMLCQYPAQVALYLVGAPQARFAYDATTDQWRSAIFIVADRRHAFLANEHESHAAVLNLSGMEYMNVDGIADMLVGGGMFEYLASDQAMQRVRPVEFLAGARTCGLRLERWTEGGLSGLDAPQWVAVTDEEVAAYERELAPVAA